MAGGNPTLTVVYNADQVVAGGGDIAISPDNIDASAQYLMINEDGTDPGSRPVMAAKGRDGSIWRFRIVDGKPGVDVSSASRVVELDAGRPVATGRGALDAGIWETSGIIDMSHIWGPQHVALRRPGPPADRGACAEHGRGRAAPDDGPGTLTYVPPAADRMTACRRSAGRRHSRVGGRPDTARSPHRSPAPVRRRATVEA